MRQLVLYVICYFLTPLFVKSQTVVSINIDAVINPATAEYIHRGIEKAKKEKPPVSLFTSILLEGCLNQHGLL